MTPPAGVLGVLLVGGASRRFGSAKALARLEGETLAERGYRTLIAAFGRAIAVGKAADELSLPFPVLDDRSELRAPLAGLVGALRLGQAELYVVVPTDLPCLTVEALQALARAARGVDVAIPQTGPLPGAYRRTSLPVLEAALAREELALHRALAGLKVSRLELAASLLRNINTPEELAQLADERAVPGRRTRR